MKKSQEKPRKAKNTPSKAKISQESKSDKKNQKTNYPVGRLGRPPRPGAGKVLCTIVYQYRILEKQESRKAGKQESRKAGKQESRKVGKQERRKAGEEESTPKLEPITVERLKRNNRSRVPEKSIREQCVFLCE